MDIKYWLESAVAEIIERVPEGKIIVSSGVSPSGPYHVGHLREVLTADALTYGLRQAGREARHVHFVDDFDQLRKVPQGVGEDFEQYLGTPYYLAPAPEGEGSYADYYFNKFKEVADALLVDMEIVRSFEQYQQGMFVDTIEKTLQNIDKTKQLIEDISHRQLPREWSPVQVLGADKKLTKAKFISINLDEKTATFVKDDGEEISLSYKDGYVKLDWRLDWPARWATWDVQVEPFGRDHATKGGSYDTGKELIQELFAKTAPIPYPYEFINRKGETKKLSASSGDVITPMDTVRLMPPELLRYFVIKSRPSLQLFFDTGLGYGRLFDEFKSLVPSQKLDALSAATLNSSDKLLSDIPFVHLLTAWQSSQKDAEKAIDIIVRSEHGETAREQSELINKEFVYIDRWLDAWAPEEVKFSIQEQLPELDLSEVQIKALSSLADKLEQSTQSSDGQWFHEKIYEVKDETAIEPKELFQAIYKTILGQPFGPKAGWFLATIEKEWLIKRLRLDA